jgi:ADP-heptose:LPS heptosyltransferase
MKVLIIKNDGFGDLIISLPILSNIYYKNQKNLKLDIVLSEINSDLRFSLKNFNNIFFLKNLGTKFNPNKRISKNDMANLRKIKNTKYDICFVMRRSLNYENLKVMQFVNAKKKYTCIENTSKNKNLLNILKKTTGDWININQNNNIHEYNYYSYFIKKIGFKITEKLLEIKNFNKSDIKRIIINLSGEKQITIASNLSKLLDLVLNNSNSKHKEIVQCHINFGD